MKWVADPGLDGDVYADRPYLYGPAASSVNALYIGGKGMGEEESGGEGGVGGVKEAGLVVEEGGSAEGVLHRREKGIPEDGPARKKFFLNEENRRGWEWEAGRSYGCDFFNPYLDFNGMHSYSMPSVRSSYLQRACK